MAAIQPSVHNYSLAGYLKDSSLINATTLKMLLGHLASICPPEGRLEQPLPYIVNLQTLTLNPRPQTLNEALHPKQPLPTTDGTNVLQVRHSLRFGFTPTLLLRYLSSLNASINAALLTWRSVSIRRCMKTRYPHTKLTMKNLLYYYCLPRPCLPICPACLTSVPPLPRWLASSMSSYAATNSWSFTADLSTFTMNSFHSCSSTTGYQGADAVGIDQETHVWDMQAAGSQKCWSTGNTWVPSC